MKKSTLRLTRNITFVAMAGLLFQVSLCVSAAGTHKEVTNKLIKLLKGNPRVEKYLVKSIKKAKRINPDRKTNPVQSLEEYYDFIDEASDLIPRQVLSRSADLTRDHILQSICYFYFLVDQPLIELRGKRLFNNTIQYYPPFSSWLRDFAESWGDFLDTKASWGPEYYSEFLKDPRFGLKRGWYESPDNWDTFNRFFSRYLKSPGERPISSPGNPSVVTSPADSVPQGVWSIDGRSRIHVAGGLKVKLVRYFKIQDLLGSDSKYKNSFANGTLTHTFLNVNDYHRFHFAVGGKILEMNILQRNVALEVAWDKGKGEYVPIDSTGWQFSQTLGYVVIDTEKYGLVALIPMGMAQVSSVKFEDDVKVGSTHKKGDMLGTFLFGGSDFIILFQGKANFELTAPAEMLVRRRKGSDHGHYVTSYKHILMGEEYGRMKGR